MVSTVTRSPKNWVLLGLETIVLALAVSAAGPSGGEAFSADMALSERAAELVFETNGAIAFWEERITRDPWNFIAYNKLGDLYLRRAEQTGDVSDYARAQAAFESSVGLLEQNYEGRVLLAYTYNSQHEFDKAMARAAPLVEEYPDKPFGWGVLGDAQLATGQYDEAERSYGRMVGIAPSLASFSRAAHIAEVHGDLALAELNWTNALSVDSGDMPETTAWALVEFGRFHFNHGNLDAAEDAYRASLQAFPSNIHAIAGLGAVRAARGDDDGAVALYEQVVDRNPLPDYVITLGHLYTRSGEHAEADRQYALAGAIGQLYEANGIRDELSLILFDADRREDLDEVLTRAEAAHRDRPSIWAADAYGWALYGVGRYEEARTQAEAALSLGTQDALFYFHAGMIAAKQGDTAAAVDYLSEALRINPHFHVLHAEDARAMLEDLDTAS